MIIGSTGYLVGLLVLLTCWCLLCGVWAFLVCGYLIAVVVVRLIVYLVDILVGVFRLITRLVGTLVVVLCGCGGLRVCLIWWIAWFLFTSCWFCCGWLLFVLAFVGLI